AVANGYVYVGSGSSADSAANHVFYAINAANGAVSWQYGSGAGEGFDLSSPAVAEGKVFVTSDQWNGILAFGIPDPTATPSRTSTASRTPTPTLTATVTATPSLTLTSSPTLTASQTVTITGTGSDTATATLTTTFT